MDTTHIRAMLEAGARDEDGSSNIASLLIVPVALLLVFLVPQAGAWYFASTVAQSAANTAYSTSRVMDGSTVDGQAAAQQVIAQHPGTLQGATVSITTTGERMTVTVSGTAPSFTGEWISPKVSRSVTGPVERVVQ